MIEQLKSAAGQLRMAWDNYFSVYSTLQNYDAQRKPPHACDFPSELPHQLDTELAFISSYEPKIQEIKVFISRIRNCSSSLVPINTLPTEILTRIFYLVLAQPCDLHQLSNNKKDHFRYPDYLAHVCSLWRQVSTSSCSLWCHIDLSPYEPYSDKLVARAKVHAARAGEIPIELHIADNELNYLEGPYNAYRDIYELLSRMLDRMKTLEFVMTREFGSFHRSVLSRLFRSQHSTLTKLVVRSECDHYDTFIVDNDFIPREMDRQFKHLPLALDKGELESRFSSLTVLHLRGIFPLWSSAAYHGIVDLRLLSTYRWSHIKEAQLIVVLKSSPGLRILHFGLEIRESAPNGEQVAPVHLQDLQVVKVFPSNDRNERTMSPISVLRLLAPGTKPLRLSFDDYYESGSAVELEKFFSRSRVAVFYSRTALPPFSVFLRHAAHLECVMFDGSRPGDEPEFPQLQADTLASLPRLRSLHIMQSTLLEADLRLLLTCCLDIVLQSCYIRLEDIGGPDSGRTLSATLLSDTFPGVRATDHVIYPPEAPTASWDLLD